MASTTERQTTFNGLPISTAITYLLKANSTVLAGTLGMQVAGKTQKAATGQTGAVLLGVAQSTYANTTGSDVTRTAPMVFKRGYCYLKNSGNDPVVAADLGGPVLVEDEDTVKTGTAGAGDMVVTALEIQGTQVLCLVGP